MWTILKCSAQFFKLSKKFQNRASDFSIHPRTAKRVENSASLYKAFARCLRRATWVPESDVDCNIVLTDSGAQEETTILGVPASHFAITPAARHDPGTNIMVGPSHS
jgi:UDP-N-acetylglucosamine 2-epimerase